MVDLNFEKFLWQKNKNIKNYVLKLVQDAMAPLQKYVEFVRQTKFFYLHSGSVRNFFFSKM